MLFLDYAHFGPAFITWHRHLNIVFEYEVQWMLQRMGRSDYHTYRSPYFDWRSDNPDWPTLERINRAISFETFDVAPWTEISSDGFHSFVDFEIGSDPDVCRNDRMCLCAGGDINCTNPAIAAGSPVTTLFSRIHTTVSIKFNTLKTISIVTTTLMHMHA